MKKYLFIILIFFFLTNSADASLITSPKDIFSGLTNWWTFDGNDTTTVFIGKGSNAQNLDVFLDSQRISMVAPGKMGQGMSCANKGSMRTTTSFSPPSLVSISFWFIQNNYVPTSNGGIIEHGNVSARLGGVTASKLNFFVDGGSSGSTVTPNVIAPNHWYNVVLTSTANSQILYLDGIQVATATETLNTATGTFFVCNGSGGAGSPGGLVIDNVREYNRILSSAEVKQLYNLGSAKIISPQGLQSGLVGWWTFDGANMKTNVADSSGQNNNGSLQFGTLGNVSTSSIVTAGKIGQGLRFDGRDDYIDITGNPSSLRITGNITVSAWVKPNIVANHEVVTKLGSSGNESYALEISFIGGVNRPQFRISTLGTSATLVTTPTPTGSAPVGKWTLITGVYDGANVKIYINGVFDKQTATTTGPFDSTTNVSLGRYSFSSSNKLNGTMDDARIYNRALSATEIKKLYNAGSVKMSN